MRIIAGIAKGTVLFSPSDLKVRPTSDRSKETLSNILTQRLNGSHVLDLFCGSGALGLEALSRGAVSTIFIDSSPESIKLARKNAEKAKLSEKSRWVLTELPEGLERLCGGKYDLIFVDPPYEKALAQKVLRKIAELDLLQVEGCLIIEHDKKEKLPEKFGEIVRFREKQVGRAQFSFYQIENN